MDEMKDISKLLLMSFFLFKSLHKTSCTAKTFQIDVSLTTKNDKIISWERIHSVNTAGNMSVT